MKERVVHKIVVGSWALCGARLELHDIEYNDVCSEYWRKVTCKRCLKKRKGE